LHQLKDGQQRQGKTLHPCGSPQLWSRSISLTHRVFHEYLSENTTTGSANVENNHDLSLLIFYDPDIFALFIRTY
jgi:hypothetical protein